MPLGTHLPSLACGRRRAPHARSRIRRVTFEAQFYPDEYFENLHTVTRFAAPPRKFRERDRDILRLADASDDKVILDLGTARGEVCFLLAPHAQEVIGIDASPKALALAEAGRKRRALSNVRFVQGDVATLEPIPAGSVDVAGAFDLLEHIDDSTVRQMLDALRRVLKKGGVLAVYTPNRQHYVERLKAHDFILKQFPEHIAVRRPREIERLLVEGGWRVTELTYSTSPFPGVRWIEKLLWWVPVVGQFFRYRILLKAEPGPR